MKEPLLLPRQHKVMGWPFIIVIMAMTGLIVGISLGAIGGALGLNSLGSTGVVGVVMGIVGGVLIGRRQAAIKNRPKS